MNTVTTTAPAGIDTQLQQWGQDTSKLQVWANSLIVASPSDFEAANTKLVFLKDVLKALEAEKERQYRPIKIALKRVEDDFNPNIKSLTAIEKTVRSKMATFHAAEQARQRKEEERLAEERRQEALRVAAESEAALKAQAEVIKQEGEARAAEALAAGDEDMAAAITKQTQDGLASMSSAHEEMVEARFGAADTVGQVAKTRVTGLGNGFTSRMVTKHKLADISQVPARFLLLNDTAVTAYIAECKAAGTTPQLPGVEFYDEAVGSVVTARRAA